MRLYRFSVKGSGNFPLSLLALGECWPASLGNAEMLSYAVPTQAPEKVLWLATQSDPMALWKEWELAKWPIQRIE